MQCRERGTKREEGREREREWWPEVVILVRSISREVRRPLAQFCFCTAEEQAATTRVHDEQSFEQNKSETAGKNMTVMTSQHARTLNWSVSLYQTENVKHVS